MYQVAKTYTCGSSLTVGQLTTNQASKLLKMSRTKDQMTVCFWLYRMPSMYDEKNYCKKTVNPRKS